MKAVAGRDEDIADLMALIQFTGLKNADEVLSVVQQYVPSHLLKPQIQYTVQDIFDELDALNSDQAALSPSSQGGAKCRVCGRPLKSESSIRLGVGPTCAKHEH